MAARTTLHRMTDTRDFEVFYRRERAGLYRALALTLADMDLAAEAVDEGMTRAYQRWRRVRSYHNPAGWVYRVGLNWATSRLRRRRFTSAATVPDRGAIDSEPADAALWAAVATLPLNQRAAIVLRYGLDWPLERVAEAVEAPIGTVKSRLSRGMATLRTRLEVDG